MALFKNQHSTKKVDFKFCEFVTVYMRRMDVTYFCVQVEEIGFRDKRKRFRRFSFAVAISPEEEWRLENCK